MAGQETIRLIKNLGDQKVAEMLEKAYSLISELVDTISDEGDHCVLNSTNDLDALRDLRDEWFQLRYLDYS